MTPREYMALKYFWADQKADFFNANFSASDHIPFIAQDFLYPGARAERKATAARNKQEALMASQRLAKMRPDSTEGVPQWALEVVH